jgi:hypothetical protein
VAAESWQATGSAFERDDKKSHSEGGKGPPVRLGCFEASNTLAAVCALRSFEGPPPETS